MKLTEFEKNQITIKNQQLESIKPILKSEFIGIDNVIDEIIDSIRAFFIFPKSLKRPLVVSLWGLTGTGKTHIIQRLVELLDLKNRFVRFDVGEYTGSDYRLRADLSDEVSKLKEKNIIIVFDEFQFGRTIDENNLEIASNAMRPVWDLLDSGKISRFNGKNFSELWDAFELLQKCIDAGVEIENNYITKNEKAFHQIFQSYYLKAEDFEMFDLVSIGLYQNYVNKKNEMNSSLSVNNSVQQKKNKRNKNNITNTLTPKEFFINSEEALLKYNIYTEGASNRYLKAFKKPYVIKSTFLKLFYNVNPEFFGYDNSIYNIKSKIPPHSNLKELFDFLKKNFYFNTSIMVEEDYSQSLIFCVGNIDEAYTMSDSSDPDADADIFYEHSLKITIPKMKSALSSRFRMEQIGRLGNTHIIYPAFNKESYRKIINKHIAIREKYFQEEFGLELTFDESIHSLVYAEGVFPSQGVRPLLSTFNKIIDSYTSKLISDIILKFPDCSKIKWNFDSSKEKHVILSIDEYDNPHLIAEYEVKLNIEKLRKTDYSEQQAFTGLHEAGHAVIAVLKAGLVPKEVVSKTAGNAEGFCRTEWPDIDTKDLLYKQILVALGGIEAEKIIFGETLMANGAGSDLRKATSIASTMIKALGMGNKNYVVEKNENPMNEYSAIHDSGKSEEHIKGILDRAQVEVKECLQENKLFLLDVAERLGGVSKLGQEEMRQIALKYVSEKHLREKDKYYNFRDIISGMKKTEEAIAVNKNQKKQHPDIPAGLLTKEVILNQKPKDDSEKQEKK